MTDDNDRNTASRRAADWENFSQIAPWFSPDTVMRAMRPIMVRTRLVRHDHPAPTTAHGRYQATRDLHAAPEQIEHAIHDLRRALEAPAHDPSALLADWIAVEPVLDAAERDTLHAALVKRLFPDSPAAPPSRAGHSQAGGHAPCP